MGGTFFRTDLGARDLTQKDLDLIALDGGVVGSIGYGFAQPDHEIPARHGYGFRWINTKGMGNHGTLILTAKSARAAEYLRTGRIDALMGNHGIDRVLATRIEHARRGVKYGREHAVVQCVIDYAHVDWESFPGVGGGASEWARRWHIDAPLSMPRLEAAAKIGQRLWGLP